MALTAKKKLFAEALLRGKFNKDAAVEAGSRLPHGRESFARRRA